jgi:hypothetical protein
MAEFKIVWEIELSGDNPLEAAKTAKKWLEENGCGVFTLQNVETKEIFSVDLNEEDEDAVLPVKIYEPLIQS